MGDLKLKFEEIAAIDSVAALALMTCYLGILKKNWPDEDLHKFLDREIANFQEEIKRLDDERGNPHDR